VVSNFSLLQMDEKTEPDLGVTRKAHKRGAKNVSSSKRPSNAARTVMAPPSFLKVSTGILYVSLTCISMIGLVYKF